MRQVPRHFFVPEALRGAPTATPLPIRCQSNYSQPFIVARMTELLQLDKKIECWKSARARAIKTAVLAQLAAQVYAIERIGELAREAQLAFATSDLQCDGQSF